MLAIAIATNAPTVTSRKRNASASLRNGFNMRALDDVDRRVDDDPHHVDEVPVDPRDLNPVVVLGRVVTAEGARGGEAEQRQADEDVRAVQAGQAEERRRERVVAGSKADPCVLGDL